ncbi:MAG: hypothetical protein Q4C87_09005 [Actinomycetaceae bacterium]|nr:hypothetical protein [Actinomycetaceae bacterium]
MRKRTLIALGLLAGAAALAKATSGLTRIGMTASEAAISLPGDMEVPMADVVVDRSVDIQAPDSIVWSIVDDLVGKIEIGMEERGGSDAIGPVVIREERDCLVVKIPLAGDPAEETTFPSTCAFVLLPMANGRTRLHLRERHLSTETVPAWKVRAALAIELPSAMALLNDVKKAAEVAAAV